MVNWKTAHDGDEVLLLIIFKRISYKVKDSYKGKNDGGQKVFSTCKWSGSENEKHQHLDKENLQKHN